MKIRQLSAALSAISALHSDGVGTSRGAELSQPADPHHLAVPARRRQRRAGAHHRRQARRSREGVDRDREPSGRGRGDRNPGARQVAARRLHAGALRLHARRRAHALQTAAIRSEQGFRAGRAGCALPVPAGGDVIAADQVGRGTDRAGQAKARRDHVRLPRRRHLAASVHRAAQGPDRHGLAAHSLQRHRAGRRSTSSPDVSR